MEALWRDRGEGLLRGGSKVVLLEVDARGVLTHATSRSPPPAGPLSLVRLAPSRFPATSNSGQEHHSFAILRLLCTILHKPQHIERNSHEAMILNGAPVLFTTSTRAYHD